MAVYIALVPRENYEIGWANKIRDRFYINPIDFYEEFKDGILLSLDNYLVLSNLNDIKPDIYYIQKVNVR